MRLRRLLSKLILLIVAIGALVPIYQMRVVSRRAQEEEIENFKSHFSVEEEGGVFSVAQAELKTLGVLYVPSIDLSIPIYDGTSEYAITEGSGLIAGTGDLSGAPGQNPVITSHNGVSDKNLFMNLEKVKPGDPYYMDNGKEILQYSVQSVEIYSPIEEMDHIQKAGNESLSTLRTCTPTGINSHRLHVVGRRVPFEGQMEPTKRVFSPFEILLLGISTVAFLILIFWTVRDGREARREKMEKNE